MSPSVLIQTTGRMPLLEKEKTVGRIALGRKNSFRFKMLIRHLWQPASKMASNDPFLLNYSFVESLPHSIKAGLFDQ